MRVVILRNLGRYYSTKGYFSTLGSVVRSMLHTKRGRPLHRLLGFVSLGSKVGCEPHIIEMHSRFWPDIGSGGGRWAKIPSGVNNRDLKLSFDTKSATDGVSG